MAFGTRMLIPHSALQSAESDQNEFFQMCKSAYRKGYREMRRIGSAECLPCSVILGLLEFATQNPTAAFDEAIRSKLGDSVFTQFLDSSEAARRLIPTPDFTSEFITKCYTFLNREQISWYTDAGLSNIARISTALRVKVVVLKEGVDDVSTIGTGAGTVCIGIVHKTCFLFYPSLTKDSFVILPCGHLQLRLQLSFQIQTAAKSLALAQSDALNAEVCQVCQARYTPALYPMLMDIAQGGYRLTVGPLLSQSETGKLVCRSCYRQLAAWEVSTLCRCSETVCVNCMIIARADRSPTICPACSKKVLDEASIEKEALLNPNLASYLPPNWRKRYEQRSKEMKCNKCGEAKPIETYVDFGVHLNCWVCSVCVAAAYRRNPHVSIVISPTISSTRA